MNTLNVLARCVARIVSVLLFFILAFYYSTAHAQVPRTISYQGFLASNGTSIKNGIHVLKISLYLDATGGTPIYTESLSTNTNSGFFTVVIGSTFPIPLSVSFDRPYFFGVAVDGNDEMTPRTEFTSAPYALHSEIADYANGVSPTAKGIVTSINELSGNVLIAGDSTVAVTSSGRIIQLHAFTKNDPAIRNISDSDNTLIVSNPDGPRTKIGVADNGISTRKIANQAITPNKINQAGATNGQVLKWNGTTWIPSDDNNFVPIAGNDITITGNTISVIHPLPLGTINNSTLRWNGINWIENINLLSDASGLTTINNNILLSNNGPASEMRFFEPSASGAMYSAFKAQDQLSNITYTLPASLPSSLGLLSVDNSGQLNWATSLPWKVSFDQITSGINQSQTLTVGNGSILAPSGSGIVTANQFVGSGSTTNAVDLATSEVSGILPIQNGGTNSGTALANNRLMISQNGSIIEASSGTTGQVLMSGGTNNPTWNTINLLPNGTINNSTLRWNATTNGWQENTNILATSAGSLTVNNGVNLNTSSSPLQLNGSSGTNGQILISAGVGNTPTWSSINLLPTGTATDNTLRWNGTAWVETANVKSSAVGLVTANAGVNLNGTTSPLQANGSSGTSGQVLISGGSGNTPSWNTINLLPTGTATDNTLRWNGTAWVETANVRSSASGLVTANAGVNLNGTSSPLQANGSTGTSGQFLASNGASTPTWTTFTAGNNITLTSSAGALTISASAILPNGSAVDNTLRWNGTSWVETSNVRSSAVGLVTANAGLNLNGITSPILLNNVAGTAGQFLTSSGIGNTPIWTTTNLLPTGTATDNTLRWNGTNWVETANVKSSSAGLVTANAGVNLNGTTSPLQLNGSGGTSGQFLTSAGTGNTPTWTTGNLLANGTATDNTLRWNGTSWVETANVKSSAVGLVTANAGVNLNGTTSPLQANGSAGTSGQILTSTGTGSTPSWTTLTAGTNITITPSGGVLTIASTGGIANGTATDNTLRWNGTSWVETSNVTSSVAGLLTVKAGANLSGTTSPLQLNGAAGTSGQILTSAGTGNTPTWNSINLLPTGTATDNTLRWNGTSWVETANVKSSAVGLVTANAGVNLNGTASPLQANGSAGTSGQILTSGGTGATPSWTTLTAGNNITLTSSAGALTIAASGGLANGTATDNTLRWNGTSWVETSNVTSSAAGLLTVKAGTNLSGTTSPLQLNGVAGTSGQFLTSGGAGNTPTWTTGNLLANGTATDNTLRWNGTSWVETANVKSSAAGLVTANAGVNLNGTTSPLQANGSSGTSGQFLTSSGAGATSSWTTLTAGNNITLTSSAGALTIAASGGLANGTATDNTLRWNGTSWVETSNITSSAAGLLTVKAGVNHSGATSPLQVNGAAGTSGQVLTSAGAGLTPTWTTVNVLTNGTANDNTLRWNGTNWVESANIKSSAAGLLTVNAGITVNNNTSPLNVRGSDGTANYVLTSQGAGNTPQWVDPNTLVSAWKLGGNSGTSPGMSAGQNYIGTSDAKDLYIGQNGLEHIRISSTSASTATNPLGVIHTKSVLPGGGSGLITGLTVETLLPSGASNPVVPVGGLFTYSTVSNSFSLGVFCAQNSTVYINGTANTNTVRALDGIWIAQNTTSGLTHSSGIGVYGSLQTYVLSNNTTITNGASFRSDFQLYSTSTTITNAHGLYIENPILGFGVSGSAITNYNGIYIENLSTGTTRRAFFYDATGTNAPVAITSAGQLGIGRKDPTQALEIQNGNILLSNNNNTADELRLGIPSSSGAYYTAFKAGAQSASITYTLPTALPAANNGLLTSSTTGILSWGSNLAWDNSNYRLGLNTTAPATTVDINGDVAMRENAFTATGGNNNDINIGNYSFVRVSGPGAAFTITGVANGVNGKMVILYNSTAQNMTISHNDNNSTTAADRIYCKGAANLVVGQYGVVSLIYNATDSRWIVVSTN